MKAPEYTKNELRKIFGHLSRLLPPGGRPLNAEEVVDVSELIDKTKVMIATHAGAIERGAKVLEWRLRPKYEAPSMNEYTYMKPWQRKEICKALDKQLHAMVATTPGLSLYGAQKQRWVRVTRFTTQPKRVDDAAVDAIGGKMPVDALVRCGVLAGDTPALLKREAIVAKTERGNTHVLVEVFEVSQEAVPEGDPHDARVEPIVFQGGPMTQAILGGPRKRARR